mgnify:CR=1 FL=1
MVRCALCGRKINDPTECIVYQDYKFDKVEDGDEQLLWSIDKMGGIFTI